MLLTALMKIRRVLRMRYVTLIGLQMDIFLIHYLQDFQKSLMAGKFSGNLKHAVITGVFKSGTRTDAKNHSPIALTSHLSKVMERVVRLDLVDYLDINGLWHLRQHGSCDGCSTLSQLLEHQDMIMQVLEQGNNIDILYLDFTKAYDKVDH